MDIFAIIAEDKIKEAMKKGDFDNLPGKGQPLSFKDDLPWNAARNKDCLPNHEKCRIYPGRNACKKRN